MIVIPDSVSATAAIASSPSFETKKMSTTAKSDSITISSTIGMASRMTARFSGPAVGSPPVPRTAWTKTCHQVSERGVAGIAGVPSDQSPGR